MLQINDFFKDLADVCDECFIVGEYLRNKVLGLYAPRCEIFVANIKSSKLAEVIAKHAKINKTVKKRRTIFATYAGIDYEFIIADKHADFKTALVELLKHKYFTIDAIAYDVKNSTWFTPFNSQVDMRIKAIKLVDPSSVKWNPVLLLTAARLAAQLKFSIPLETWFTIYENSTHIRDLDAKTINKELSQLLLTDVPSIGFKYLHETGVLGHILPEISSSATIIQTRRSDATNVFSHTMYALDACEKDLVLRLVILFHDCGKQQTMTCDAKGNIHFFGHEKVSADIARVRLAELEYPKSVIDLVAHLIYHHMFDASPQLKPAAVRRLIKKVGKEHIDKLVKVREADRRGTPEKMSMRKIELLKKKISRELKHV